MPPRSLFAELPSARVQTRVCTHVRPVIRCPETRGCAHSRTDPYAKRHTQTRPHTSCASRADTHPGSYRMNTRPCTSRPNTRTRNQAQTDREGARRCTRGSMCVHTRIHRPEYIHPEKHTHMGTHARISTCPSQDVGSVSRDDRGGAGRTNVVSGI